jgi:glycosyltransferase 2 family protein
LSTGQGQFGPRANVPAVTSTLVRGEPEASETPPSLTSRLFTIRTLASLGIAAVIVAVAIWRAQIDWGAAWDNIRHANPLLYLAALGVYYASFVVRSLRWQVLLRNAGEQQRSRSLIGIVITSFFVNCVVPAKMGDIYRAYLARQKLEVPVSKALGTIIAERLIDLIVLMSLLLAAGAVVFRTKAPGILIPYVIIGVVVCLAGVGVILVMRAGRGQRILRLLPEAVFHRYESLRLGTVDSFARLPALLGLTVLVWAAEATRLGLVVFSLHLAGVHLGPSQFLLIALVAALLTTVPFLPGGLGLVEAGMIGVLITVGGVTNSAAVSITLLDRSISYASLIVFGFVIFVFTHVHVPKARRIATQG